jgi:hypothetical protein
MVRNSSREGWLMEGQRAFNHQLWRRLWTIGKHTDTNMRQTGPTLSHSRTRCSFHSDQWPHRRFFCLIWFATLLIVFGKATSHRHKGLQRNLEGFFCSVDQDGNGEIERVEATKVGGVCNFLIFLLLHKTSLHNLSLSCFCLQRVPVGKNCSEYHVSQLLLSMVT